MANILSKDTNTIYYNTLFSDKYELGVRLQDKNQYFDEHKHDYIEIVCQITNSSIHYIDDKEYILNSGEFIIINTSQTHTNVASDSDVINIIISNRFLTNLIIESSFDSKVVELKEILVNNIHTTKYKNTPKMEKVIDTICGNINEIGSPLYYLKLRLSIINYLLEFLENIKVSVIETSTKDLDVIAYIYDNIKTASLSEYSTIQHYSISVMSKKIKSEYNMTFIEILHDIRLKQSIYLLQSTNKNIDEIIYEIGYSNKTHFYKLFKDKYNMTPVGFRKYMR